MDQIVNIIPSLVKSVVNHRFIATAIGGFAIILFSGFIFTQTLAVEMTVFFAVVGAVFMLFGIIAEGRQHTHQADSKDPIDAGLSSKSETTLCNDELFQALQELYDQRSGPVDAQKIYFQLQQRGLLSIENMRVLVRQIGEEEDRFADLP